MLEVDRDGQMDKNTVKRYLIDQMYLCQSFVFVKQFIQNMSTLVYFLLMCCVMKCVIASVDI